MRAQPHTVSWPLLGSQLHKEPEEAFDSAVWACVTRQHYHSSPRVWSLALASCLKADVLLALGLWKYIPGGTESPPNSNAGHLQLHLQCWGSPLVTIALGQPAPQTFPSLTLEPILQAEPSPILSLSSLAPPQSTYPTAAPQSSGTALSPLPHSRTPLSHPDHMNFVMGTRIKVCVTSPPYWCM